jgi:hypothetical protein
MSTPMGHRTYLGPKGKGESSMFGKRKMLEAVYGIDPQGPSDMAKATLLEPQDPMSKEHLAGYNGCNPGCPLDTRVRKQVWQRTSLRDRVVVNHRKGLKRAPKSLYHIHHVRKAGSPKGREP